MIGWGARTPVRAGLVLAVAAGLASCASTMPDARPGRAPSSAYPLLAVEQQAFSQRLDAMGHVPGQGRVDVAAKGPDSATFLWQGSGGDLCLGSVLGADGVSVMQCVAKADLPALDRTVLRVFFGPAALADGWQTVVAADRESLTGLRCGAHSLPLTEIAPGADMWRGRTYYVVITPRPIHGSFQGDVIRSGSTVTDHLPVHMSGWPGESACQD